MVQDSTSKILAQRPFLWVGLNNSANNALACLIETCPAFTSLVSQTKKFSATRDVLRLQRIIVVETSYCCNISSSPHSFQYNQHVNGK